MQGIVKFPAEPIAQEAIVREPIAREPTARPPEVYSAGPVVRPSLAPHGVGIVRSQESLARPAEIHSPISAPLKFASTPRLLARPIEISSPARPPEAPSPFPVSLPYSAPVGYHWALVRDGVNGVGSGSAELVAHKHTSQLASPPVLAPTLRMQSTTSLLSRSRSPSPSPSTSCFGTTQAPVVNQSVLPRMLSSPNMVVASSSVIRARSAPDFFQEGASPMPSARMAEVRAEPVANDGRMIQHRSPQIRTEPIAKDSHVIQRVRSEPISHDGPTDPYQVIQQLHFQLRESERMNNDKQAENAKLIHLNQMLQRQIEDLLSELERQKSSVSNQVNTVEVVREIVREVPVKGQEDALYRGDMVLKEKVQAIEKRGNIKVDSATGDVRLVHPIMFVKRTTNDPPIAEFEQPSIAEATCQDLGELSAIFPDPIHIEGHTKGGTTKFWQTLADDRARIVAELMIDAGANPGMIYTVGRPGNLGLNEVRTVVYFEIPEIGNDEELAAMAALESARTRGRRSSVTLQNPYRRTLPPNGTPQTWPTKQKSHSLQRSLPNSPRSPPRSPREWAAYPSVPRVA